MLATKRYHDPVGRSSTIMSALGSMFDGAWIVVSQYGGTASACASLYDWRRVFSRTITAHDYSARRWMLMLTGGA